MEILSDIFLGAAAIGAAFYCIVLSRKISKLTGLDQDLGGAIAILSQQVDEMTRALDDAKTATDGSSSELASVADRAETAAAKLELLIASLKDPVPGTGTARPQTSVDAAEPVFRRHTKQDDMGVPQ